MAVALAAAIAVPAGCGSDAAERESSAAAPLRSSGDPLADLKVRANQLLDGGPAAFRAHLTELRGHPVVVNQWASWCGPCRLEFPFFRDQARKLERKVAFLGVNSRDSRDEAAAFLEEMPVPFPHYFDPDASIARVFRGGRSWPTTAFYDASGELAFTYQGQYASAADLEADIRRYALRG
jgi:cytochrome c biogenesis protein CcmG, thiol:disulfide interchange protein DsbE